MDLVKPGFRGYTKIEIVIEIRDREESNSIFKVCYIQCILLAMVGTVYIYTTDYAVLVHCTGN